MTKAYRETKKGIILPNGNRINMGQLFPRKENNMTPQRPLNSCSPLHPRNGAPKNIVQAPPVAGQRSRTAPSHEYLHGQTAVQDERELPIKNFENSIALHPATTPKQRATLDQSNSPSANEKITTHAGADDVS
jgi:hypothetical protein